MFLIIFLLLPLFVVHYIVACRSPLQTAQNLPGNRFCDGRSSLDLSGMPNARQQPPLLQCVNEFKGFVTGLAPP